MNTTIESEPISNISLIRIPSCLRRKQDSNGNYIATGELKKGFEWVFEDPDVICAEHVNGVNVNVYVSENPFSQDPNQFFISGIETRGRMLIAGLESKPVLLPVWNAEKNGSLNKGNVTAEELGFSIITGVIPFVGSKSQHTNFIPRNYQLRKMKYGQWRKVSPTVETVSTWLKEDLATHLKNPLELQYIACGKNTSNGKARPYGLLFFQPSTGKTAKIICNSFDWFYQEGLKKVKQPTVSQSTVWFSMTKEEQDKFRVETRQLKEQYYRQCNNQV